jgi:hypothetical protein
MEFKAAFENLDLGREPIALAEALSAKELDAMRKIVATPDVRPCDFDLSIDGWIARLELWGKVRISHTDPEFNIRNKALTLNQFLDKVSATNINKVTGKFDIDRKDINKVEMFREYVGANDKKYRESFMITVELKPELKKALK